MILRLVLVSGGLLLAPAWAIHPAARDDREKLTTLLEEAKSAADDVQTAVAREKELERNIEILSLSKRNEYDIREDQIELDQVKRVIAEKTPVRDIARNKALHLALTAYGITATGWNGRPAMPAGTGSMPDAWNGKTFPWIPVASERAGYRTIGPGGEHVVMKAAPKDRWAETMSNGITFVYDDAFKSPGILAAILYHESIHFQQFTSDDPGRLSGSQRELDAWRKTDEGLGTMGLDEEAKAELRSKFIDRNLELLEEAVRREKWWQKATWGLKKPSILAPAAIPEDEMDDLTRRFNDLSEAMARETAHAKAATRRQRLMSARDAAARVAREACGQPGDVDQARLDALPRDFDADSLIAGMPSGWDSEKDRCLVVVYTAIGFALAGNDPLNSGYLKSLAHPVRPRPLSAAPAAPPSSEECGRQMAELAAKACADPGAVSEADLSAVNRWFPDSRCGVSISSDWGLSPCAFETYKWLRDENDRSRPGMSLRLDWVQWAGRSFAQKSHAATPSNPRPPRRESRDMPSSPRGPNVPLPGNPNWDGR